MVLRPMDAKNDAEERRRMPGEKPLLMTMTGEMHQPVRLYYEVNGAKEATLELFLSRKEPSSTAQHRHQ